MIKNIVFSGGAFKGWAYIGTIRALNEYIRIKEEKEGLLVFKDKVNL